jgi:hypothetical protein
MARHAVVPGRATAQPASRTLPREHTEDDASPPLDPIRELLDELEAAIRSAQLRVPRPEVPAFVREGGAST